MKNLKFTFRFLNLKGAICLFLTFHSLLFTLHGFSQGVSINSSNAAPDPSAMLDVSGTTTGVLINRMTSAQRNAIVNPAEGLQIFNTDTKCINFYKNHGWFEVCGNCVPPAAPVAGNNGPLCLTSTLNLTASAIPYATYSWTGPNGFTSTAQNPSITNVTTSNGGVYSVMSYINCNSSVATTSVTVIGPIPSTFTWSSLNPLVNELVTFTPTQTGASYSWTFQGGNPATSTAQNPVVSWAIGGTYNVSLTVTVSGCVSVVTTQQITATCPPGTASFTYTGAVQTWTVPPCIASISIDAKGAQGGGPAGGKGGRAIATVTVTPGSTLYIYVGGQPTTRPGATSGGFNGGGKVMALPCGGSTSDGWGGGGASDVRTSVSLSDRLIVAAGGGGSGYSSGAGGIGGGLTGGSGTSFSGIATGGTQTGGGTSGANPGSLGIGGDAGPLSALCIGGGGGGGYYGGAGGSTGSGGGGSSWTGYPGSTNTTNTANYNTGNGSISITY
ncbi:MAG: glycine-rich protein [Bacteroidota bacterium]